MWTKKLQGLITLIRHGEKDSTGILTEKGELQILSKALKTNYLGGEIVVYHSGVDRVKKSVEIARNFLLFTQEDMLSDSLTDFFSKHKSDQEVSAEESEYLHYLQHKNIHSNYYSTWDERTNTDNVKTNREFLGMKNTSPEPGIAPSPVELSKRVCHLLVEQIDYVRNSPVPVNIINGTHEPVFLAFIQYALAEYNKNAEVDIEHIGGPIAFAETADIELYMDEHQEMDIYIRFRTFLTHVTLPELQSFISDSQ